MKRKQSPNAFAIPVVRGQNMGSRWISGKFAYVSSEKAKTLEAIFKSWFVNFDPVKGVVDVIAQLA